MNIKLGTKEIPLYKIAKVKRVGNNLADVYFLTGNAIRVECCWHHPDGCTFSYPGTFRQLKTFIDKHKGQR